MADLETVLYEADGRIARITLDRPERGNGITPRMPVEIAACVERANLDPEVHVIVKANVARSDDEAALQSQGVDILAQVAQEDRAEGEGRTSALRTVEHR